MIKRNLRNCLDYQGQKRRDPLRIDLNSIALSLFPVFNQTKVHLMFILDLICDKNY